MTEATYGIARNRDGVERHGSPACVVISSDGFNDTRLDGLIVMPMISGLTVDVVKFKNVPSTWVRVISQGEPGYVLVEQVRYVDRRRCGALIDDLAECDLKQV